MRLGELLVGLLGLLLVVGGIWLSESLDSGPGADTTFTIKITTPDGENVSIKRTTPEELAPVMNLQ